jgi:hypothetical protein
MGTSMPTVTITNMYNLKHHHFAHSPVVVDIRVLPGGLRLVMAPQDTTLHNKRIPEVQKKTVRQEWRE